MKAMKLYKAALLILTLGVVVALPGCDSDEGPTDEQLFLDQLKGDWTFTTGSVKVDNVDVTNAFKDMKITFSSNRTFKVTNPVAPIWPASGSFVLASASNGLFNFMRNDDVLVTVSEITETSLKLNFNYAPPSGRVESVGGNYEFSLSR